MKSLPLSLIGLGVGLPDRQVGNEELASGLETSDEWIRSRTGISSRYLQPEDQGVTPLTIQAGRAALEKAGIGPEEVDLVVVATVTPDAFMPATSCRVAAALGCSNAGAFDLNVACSGFLYALLTSAAQLHAAKLRYVLCIGGDAVSKIVDWKDRRTAVLFGDGAGATVLSREGSGRLLGWDYGIDGSLSESLHIPAGPSRPSSVPSDYKVKMDGRAVFRFATQILVESSHRALERAGLKVTDLDLIVPHQANRRIIEGAAKKWKVPMERFLVNVDRMGNTSAGSVPLALAEAEASGRVPPGGKILLSGFGGGLSWASLVLQWKS